MKEFTCGFISQHYWEHSPLASLENEQGNHTKDRLKAVFLPLIEKRGVNHFLVMMDRGHPLEALEVLLSMQAEYPITLECVIPYEEQHITWSEDERERYFRLIGQCEKEYMIQSSFSVDCYRSSIKYLLSSCEHFVIISNGQPSDAEDAIQFARRKNLKIMIVDPSDL